MDRDQLIALLRAGADAWNQARRTHRALRHADLQGVDLSNASLTRAELGNADLRGANLSKASLYGAELHGADLREAILDDADLSSATLTNANLDGAHLVGTMLRDANLSKASLVNANLTHANLWAANLNLVNLSGATLRWTKLAATNLTDANLSRADLTGASLALARLVETNLEGAKLIDCSIYGISAWDLRLDGATQRDLVVTPPEESIPKITVDDIEVGQFVYLLLDNRRLRKVIDVVTSTAVLILGRFTPERKVVLELIRTQLRRLGYSPVLFDFDKPSNKNVLDTVRLLAHLARFVIADITDASFVRHELAAIVPAIDVAVQPLLLDTEEPYPDFAKLVDRPSLLAMHRYSDPASLEASFSSLIGIIEERAAELRRAAALSHPLLPNRG